MTFLIDNKFNYIITGIFTLIQFNQPILYKKSQKPYYKYSFPAHFPSLIKTLPTTHHMQLVKRSHQSNFKSQQFRQEYTSQNTSRPSNTSRLNEPREKRFKRNKTSNQNHSKSSSNCSESSSISKFYVKNITSLLPVELIHTNESVQTAKLAKNGQGNQFSSHPTKENQKRQVPNPRQSIKTALNSYGLTKEGNLKSPIKERKEDNNAKKNINSTTNNNDTSINVSNFLRRQFSPQTPNITTFVQNSKGETLPIARKSTRNINVIEDSYNFLSPVTKRLFPTSQDPKPFLEQLTKQRNKTAQLHLQLEKCKNNQKKLSLLNEQLDLKAKRLAERINTLQQELNKTSMNNAKLKDENHRMKVLVKQRDCLMNSLVDRERGSGGGKKEGGSQVKGEGLVAKVVEYEYENERLRDTIHKLKKQLEQHQHQSTSSIASHTLIPSQPCLTHQPSTISSQITWDDRQFTDCLQQKDKQLLQLRQQIKNLQIQINYINRKWTNQIQRVKKIQKLEWMKLKDKYKELLMKYKDKVKMNFVLPPDRERVMMRERKEQREKNGEGEEKVDKELDNQNSNKTTTQNNPQSPRRRKRNYTVQHLKGRGVMSDIRISYGGSKIVNPYEETAQLQLLEYSSCDEDFGV